MAGYVQLRPMSSTQLSQRDPKFQKKLERHRRIKRLMLSIWSIWPPFLGTGIQVKRISADFKEIDVRLKLRFWNANYVGTQFGGSMFSMTDPFYMVMLYETLGPGYIVWDKSATIHYRKPGKSDVWAYFRLTDAQINEYKSQADQNGKCEPELRVEIKDPDGNLIAEVIKVLYIRKKS